MEWDALSPASPFLVVPKSKPEALFILMFAYNLCEKTDTV